MKKIWIAVVFISVLFIMGAVGCLKEKIEPIDKANNTNIDKSKENQKAYDLDAPENIIYYNNGNRITISKEDVKFEPIVDEIKGRVKGIKDQYKSHVSINDLKAKGLLLELEYSNKQTFKYVTRNGENKTIYYTKLYFDLDKSDSVSNLMIFEGEGFGPIGPLFDSEKLLDLLSQGGD